MKEERLELYQRDSSPPERSILVALDPFPVYDSILEAKEVAVVVRHLRLNKDDSLSGMKVEHLRAWLWAATWEKFP